MLPVQEKSVIRSLVRMLGSSNVIHDAEQLNDYSRDALDVTRALPRGFRPRTPIAVARPVAERDVSKILRFANRNRIPVVPYGGGTGLMGGAATLRRGIVIDLKRLNGIEVIEEDLAVRAGAGVVIKDLDSALRKRGLMLAHDPWSAFYATVGGAISTNGVGYLAGKYGSMGDQVLGMRVALPDGSIMEIRPASKASGTHLKDLFIGTEGVLGIVTSATLRAHPLPELAGVLAFEFKDLASGYRAVMRMAARGIRPTSLDLFEVNDLALDNDTRLWLQDRPGTRLYVFFDGLREEVEARIARTGSIAGEFGALQLDENEAGEYWRSRYGIAERYISFIRSTSRNTDIRFDFVHAYIPAGKVLEFDRAALEIASRHRVMVQGHGIWNQPEFYSINLFAGSARANDRMCRAIDGIIRLAGRLGAMEYCHGIGVRLARSMRKDNARNLRVARKIKHALDPRNIMNPGKMAL